MEAVGTGLDSARGFTRRVRGHAAGFPSIGSCATGGALWKRPAATALGCSIRLERQRLEQLDYNLLYRWFVGLAMDAPVWDASPFSKNRDRVA